MAYIDYEFYTDTYKGESVDEADFPALAERASRNINELTGFKIEDFEKLNEKQQFYVKLATASQLEHLDNSESLDGLASATLGKFSFSSVTTSSSTSQKYSATARDYLAYSGLLYRGL